MLATYFFSRAVVEGLVSRIEQQRQDPGVRHLPMDAVRGGMNVEPGLFRIGPVHRGDGLEAGFGRRHGVEENGGFHNARQDDVVLLRALVFDQTQVGLLPGHAVLAASVAIAITQRACLVLCQIPHLVLAAVLEHRHAKADAQRLPRLVREQHGPHLGRRIHPQGDILGTGQQPPIDEQLLSAADVDGLLLRCTTGGGELSGRRFLVARWCRGVDGGR